VRTVLVALEWVIPEWDGGLVSERLDLGVRALHHAELDSLGTPFFRHGAKHVEVFE
jgi:hypothetical protein